MVRGFRPPVRRPIARRALAAPRLLGRTWLRADGQQLDVRAVAIDSGGHFTDEVYAFSRANGVRWAIPIKGANEPGKPIAAFLAH